MRAKVDISSLIPGGLVAESIVEEDDARVVTTRPAARPAACPLCGTETRRVHSRYVRSVWDLPCAGRRIRLRIEVRRLRCEVPQCRRRIFAERFAGELVAARSRRTARLDTVVHHLGLALAGRPGAAFGRRLMLPVSNDTLLRTVRRRSQRPTTPLAVVGVDDWAWRRSGTLPNQQTEMQAVRPLPHRCRKFPSTVMRASCALTNRRGSRPASAMRASGSVPRPYKRA